jgi:hypothetical protein
MRAREVQGQPEVAFRRFSVQIDIENIDQLRALTAAAARLCNGHGLELYPLLKDQLDQYDKLIDAGYRIQF